MCGRDTVSILDRRQLYVQLCKSNPRPLYIRASGALVASARAAREAARVGRSSSTSCRGRDADGTRQRRVVTQAIDATETERGGVGDVAVFITEADTRKGGRHNRESTSPSVYPEPFVDGLARAPLCSLLPDAAFQCAERRLWPSPGHSHLQHPVYDAPAACPAGQLGLERLHSARRGPARRWRRRRPWRPRRRPGRRRPPHAQRRVRLLAEPHRAR